MTAAGGEAGCLSPVASPAGHTEPHQVPICNTWPLDICKHEPWTTTTYVCSYVTYKVEIDSFRTINKFITSG